MYGRLFFENPKPAPVKTGNDQDGEQEQEDGPCSQSESVESKGRNDLYKVKRVLLTGRGMFQRAFLISYFGR